MDPLAHASIALITKLLAPKAPLWALVAATEIPDLLYFGLQIAGIEYPAETQLNWARGMEYLSQPFIPWSHGFLMCIIWSIIVAVIAFLFYRERRVSIAIGLMVMSHWTLDFIVYPNMPLLFDHSIVIGFGLITSRLGLILGILLEVGLIVGGLVPYWHHRKRMIRLRMPQLH